MKRTDKPPLRVLLDGSIHTRDLMLGREKDQPLPVLGHPDEGELRILAGCLIGKWDGVPIVARDKWHRGRFSKERFWQVGAVKVWDDIPQVRPHDNKPWFVTTDLVKVDEAVMRRCLDKGWLTNSGPWKWLTESGYISTIVAMERGAVPSGWSAEASSAMLDNWKHDRQKSEEKRRLERNGWWMSVRDPSS